MTGDPDEIRPYLVFEALGAVTALHRAPAPDAAEAERLRSVPLTGWERKVTSQFGEDGVLAEILRRTEVGSRWFVEFGAETGLEGTCALLGRALGWHGLLMECDERLAQALHRRYAGLPRVRTQQAAVTAANVEELFDAAGVPAEPDVVSIDVDGTDWWIWRAIRRFRPRVVVVEHNGQLTPEHSLTVPQDFAGPWDGTHYYGASVLALERLATAKGYRLVHTELNGVNAFFVREDLCAAMPDRDVVPVHPAGYGLRDVAHPPDPHGRPWVEVDPSGEPRA